jgi:nucleotide-binding universal stress UspA family protein
MKTSKPGRKIEREAWMDKINKILAPTDLSELSMLGVRYALELAQVLGAEVTAYHVVHNDALMSYAGNGTNHEGLTATHSADPLSVVLENHEITLARFLGKHFAHIIPSIKIREKVEIGIADRNIVERAKIEGTDIVVISTHGRTGLSRVLVGSVTEKVVRNAPCPVLTIGPGRIARSAEISHA